MPKRLHIDDLERARLRFAIGVFLSMALALSIAWPLAVVTPIFVGIFLTKGNPFFGLKGGGVLLITVALACFSGSLIAHYLIHLPFIALSIISLSMFLIYYYSAGEGNPFVSLMGLIGVAALPIIAQQSSDASDVFGVALFFGFGLSIAICTIMHGVLPDTPPSIETRSKKNTSVKPPPNSEEQLKSALMSTAIVFPAVAFFFINELAGGALIMLLILIQAQNPALKAGVNGSVGLFLANLLGGGMAVAYYTLLKMVPDYMFMLLSTGTTILFLTSIIFSQKSYAPLFGSALTTFLLLTWLSTTAEGDGSDVRFFSRMVQITIACLYVVCASDLMNWLFKKSRARPFIP